ncbi:TolC family protein [soil metagenome]
MHFYPFSLAPRGLLVAALALAAGLLLAGCATVSPETALPSVQEHVSERSDYRATWITNENADREAAQAVRELLADSLTEAAAVQIALLNNRHLQATYEDLGVAQAALVQAGLLRNPVFGAGAMWPFDGGHPEFSFSVAADFLGVFFRPLRRAVATHELEAAQARVAEAVLRHAAETRVRFIEYQAARQTLELYDTVVEATELSYDAARRLREAGNIRRLELLQEQSLFEHARLDREAARARGVDARETLNRAMGLWGADARRWEAAGRMPPIDRDAPDVAEMEAQAIRESLQLAARRAEIEALGRRLGFAQTEVLVPHLEIGAEVEVEGGEWAAGPEIHFALPLLDQGQARRAAAAAELRRAQATYVAEAVDLRADARAAAQQLATTHRIATHYRDVVLPLQIALTDEVQLQYNAMQVGVFHLLDAKRREVDAGRRYLEVLLDYWRVRIGSDSIRLGVQTLGRAQDARTPHTAPAGRPGH